MMDAISRSNGTFIMATAHKAPATAVERLPAAPLSTRSAGLLPPAAQVASLLSPQEPVSRISQVRVIDEHPAPGRIPVESRALEAIMSSLMQINAGKGAEAAGPARPSVISQFYEQF
ncbi:hypothetical protein KYK29_12595 [Shinella daejeonensis]|uniref:hypothetical protein n=1 Tax=Shinella daejeonensis TaxID=659017 RepID=UPI0020C79ED5|nr:hypothetical protein [Shinella daejeonensis]MCP8895762.1 hypothetical protein [Shinella daejeonensis]